ncbi:hypothetical protein [Sphingomonas sp. Leaf4]|uniref:hypothetical protein n=1 Tax=Sphingomonas sp. Leaf4 TaxID=2876553 RepID=UPI001E47D46F|nr:hypothetical protein [Sphingomonas sp. Leaf4]
MGDARTRAQHGASIIASATCSFDTPAWTMNRLRVTRSKVPMCASNTALSKPKQTATISGAACRRQGV